MGVVRYRKLFKHEPGTLICGKHWKIVPHRLKRVLARHERQKRKFGFYPREAALNRTWDAIWRHLTVEG